jgi:hypothetical protein
MSDGSEEEPEAEPVVEPVVEPEPVASAEPVVVEPAPPAAEEVVEPVDPDDPFAALSAALGGGEESAEEASV